MQGVDGVFIEFRICGNHGCRLGRIQDRSAADTDDVVGFHLIGLKSCFNAGNDSGIFLNAVEDIIRGSVFFQNGLQIIPSTGCLAGMGRGDDEDFLSQFFKDVFILLKDPDSCQDSGGHVVFHKRFSFV